MRKVAVRLCAVENELTKINCSKWRGARARSSAPYLVTLML